MGLTYAMGDDNQIAHLVCTGEFQVAEWEQRLTAMLDDLAFTVDHRVLVDRRGVTGFESEAVVQSLLRHLEANTWRLRHTLWAIVIGETAESCGRSRAFAVRATRIGIETRVFTDRGKALTWLLEASRAQAIQLAWCEGES